LKMGVSPTKFAWVGLEPRSFQSQPPNNPKITGVSHQCPVYETLVR
jgi:hypothetical protein